MPPLRFFLVGLAALVCAISGKALEDCPVEGGKLTFGLDGTLDADAGAAGSFAGHASLLGTVLGHAAWEQAESATRPFDYSAYASFLWIQGRGPPTRFVGSFLTADNTQGYQSLRLYSWWVQAEQKEWSLRAGALLADDEFALTTSGATLISSAFGWPVFISANTLNTGPAYFVPALGVRIAFSNLSGWSAKAGVYDGDSLDSLTGDPGPNRHGTHYDLGGRQGAFMMGELGYAPRDSPNRYHLGAWCHTAEFADQATGAMHPGNEGAYAIVERTLAGKTGKPGNVEAHVRFGVAPDDRNKIARAFDTAVAATGLLPARPADVIALGFAHLGLSPDLSGQNDEELVELSYSAPLTGHLTVQPDAQGILHSNGASASAEEWLFILRLTASY